MRKQVRLLLTGGGTGGHIYPALAVAAALKEMAQARNTPPPQMLFVGSRFGLEAALVPQEGLPFQAVASGPVLGRAPLAIVKSLALALLGVGQSWALLGRFRPDAVLAAGGYACVPVVGAAWLRRMPIVLFVPDIKPGLALRLLAPLARRIAVSHEASVRFLGPRKALATGYPLRPELGRIQKEDARQALGLRPSLPAVLVMGGSRGARSINEAVLRALPQLLAHCQVLHICGWEHEAGFRQARVELPPALAGNYHVFGYLHEEMAAALAAADLAVARAGAATLAEFPAAGLPSILVPYPHAAAHQSHNAAYMVAQGASLTLDDSALQDGALAPTVLKLLGDPGALTQMAERARALAHPEAAQRVATLLWEVAAMAGRPRDAG